MSLFFRFVLFLREAVRLVFSVIIFSLFFSCSCVVFHLRFCSISIGVSLRSVVLHWVFLVRRCAIALIFFVRVLVLRSPLRRPSSFQLIALACLAHAGFSMSLFFCRSVCVFSWLFLGRVAAAGICSVASSSQIACAALGPGMSCSQWACSSFVRACLDWMFLCASIFAFGSWEASCLRLALVCRMVSFLASPTWQGISDLISVGHVLPSLCLALLHFLFLAR